MTKPIVTPIPVGPDAVVREYIRLLETAMRRDNRTDSLVAMVKLPYFRREFADILAPYSDRAKDINPNIKP